MKKTTEIKIERGSVEAYYLGDGEGDERVIIRNRNGNPPSEIVISKWNLDDLMLCLQMIRSGIMEL